MAAAAYESVLAHNRSNSTPPPQAGRSLLLEAATRVINNIAQECVVCVCVGVGVYNVCYIGLAVSTSLY